MPVTQVTFANIQLALKFGVSLTCLKLYASSVVTSPTS